MTDASINEFLATFDESRFPGEFLLHYELIECLSHNAISETFRVKNRHTGKYYLAKCYSNGSVLSQTSEGDLLKKFQHKGLPAYIADFHKQGMHCIVRDYAPGESLDKRVQRDPLSKQQSLSIAVQLCDILIYLHGQKPPIIHRDIKPQNITVDEQGNVTLIDFDISRSYDESAEEDTHSLGTPRYAAPEQYGFAQTDCRSDIYSLGVLLGWLFTGEEETLQAQKRVSDRRLANILKKCTAFAPKDRYQNAAQVRHALTGTSTQRTSLFFMAAMLVILLCAFLFTRTEIMRKQAPEGITFKEPLIEQAVRLALNKPEPQEISEQDLLSISEIYVFGDKAAADVKSFETYASSFANSEGIVFRGSITVLDDLPKLKNLRRVSLCYQNIVDLTPLGALSYLETVDLRHNPIQDISPLSQLSSLSMLVVFDTKVSDLTALVSCSHLTMLDAGLTEIQSTAALKGLRSLRILKLRKAPLQSLDQIETLPMLEQIILSETQLLDLSALLTLPRLALVEVDDSMRKAAEAIADKAQFKMIYP